MFKFFEKHPSLVIVLQILGIILLTIIAIAAILAWEYYVGYLTAFLIVLTYLYAIFSSIGKSGEASGLVVGLAVSFIPLLFVLGITIWLNEYELFKLIEAGGFTLLLLVALISAISQLVDDHKRRLRKEALETLQELEHKKEKEKFKAHYNLLSHLTNCNLIDLYTKYSTITSRLIGTVTLVDESNIEYIYIPEQSLLILIILDTKECYELTLDPSLFKLNDKQYSDKNQFIFRYIQYFCSVNNLANNGFLDIPAKFGYAYSRYWVNEGFSPVKRSDFYIETNTNDNIVISKKMSTDEFGIIFVDRILTPTGLALPGGHYEHHKKIKKQAEKDEFLGNIRETVELSYSAEIDLLDKLGKHFIAKEIKVFTQDFETCEIRGTIKSRISIWYSDKVNNQFAFQEDLYNEVFVSINDIEKLLKNGFIMVDDREYFLLAHHIEILKYVFENSNISSIKSEEDIYKL